MDNNNNTITLTTKIPIKNIVNNVIKEQPQNVCEFNNLLLFEISKIFFDNLEINFVFIKLLIGKEQFSIS